MLGGLEAPSQKFPKPEELSRKKSESCSLLGQLQLCEFDDPVVTEVYLGMG